MTPYYERGGITIYCGDCLEVMPWLAGEGIVFDAVITDPPYLTKNARVTLDHEGGVSKRINKSVSVGLPWGYSDEWVDECSDITKRWVVFCNHKMIGNLHNKISDFAEVFNVFVWQKPNASPMIRPVPRLDCEYILVAITDGAKYNNMNQFTSSLMVVPMLQAGCFAKERILKKGSLKSAHPTQKPLAVITPFVSRFINKGESIIDPFMGSGTTLLAAQNEGRRAVGIELSEEYCKIAVDRLRQPSFFSIPDKPKDKEKPEQMELINGH